MSKHTQTNFFKCKKHRCWNTVKLSTFFFYWQNSIKPQTAPKVQPVIKLLLCSMFYYSCQCFDTVD